MEKEKMIEKQIAEINQNVRNGLNNWADIMLMAEADEWAVKLNYFPRDIMNATYIFQHVLSNVGIKAGKIDEKNAVEFGERLCQLVMDMTGYDPHEITKGGNDEE